MERIWWSLTVVVVEDGMIGVADVVLPWDVIFCYILDEVGGGWGDDIGGWQRGKWEGGMIERDGTGDS